MLVARPDDLLEDTEATLKSQFPALTFKKVAVDLGTREGPSEVETAIADIPCPQICFLNAGYVQTGFYNQTPLAKHFANLDCNVGHVLALSHLVINRCASTSCRVASTAPTILFGLLQGRARCRNTTQRLVARICTLRLPVASSSSFTQTHSYAVNAIIYLRNSSETSAGYWLRRREGA